jgi:hypothetical protein
MWHGLAQIVEGACAILADPKACAQMPPEVRERLQAAIRAVTGNLDPNSTS